jgi:PAS domain S-box-containing protein
MVVTSVVVLALAVLTLVAVGVYAWRHRTTAGALSFSLLMFAIAGWCLAYALELLGRDLAGKMLWLKAEYPGIVATPVLWLVFALQYTGRGRLFSRRNVALLSLLPVVTVLLVWTNQAHHLFYSSYHVDTSNNWPLLHLQYGPWFWVHAGFSYLCLLVGTLLLVGAFLRSSSLYRQQVGMLLAGALIPWAGNALYLTGLSPRPGLDLTPLAFTLSGLVVAFGLFRYGLFQVVPVARQAVVEGLPAAMVVLDAEGRIADLNPAARRLFNLTDKEAIGLPACQALRPAELVTRFASVTQADTELEWGEAGCRRAYRLTISPLDDQAAGTPARLVLVSDVTAQAKARGALEQANRRLQALQQSTAALTALLDPATLFERVMDQLESLMPYRYAVLGMYDEAADRLAYVANRGLDPEELAEAEHTALQRHPGWVVQHKSPLLVDDAEKDHWAQYVGSQRSRSVLTVPIVYQDRCLGILGLSDPQPAVYTPADRDLLLAFANHVATALENAHLYEQEQARRRLADTLQEVGRVLSATLALDQVLDRILEQLERVVDYEGAIIALLHDGWLEAVAARGFADPALIMAFRLDVSDNAIFQQIVATNAPVIIADVSQDPRWERVEGVEFTRSWIGAPLVVKERIIAQLSVYHSQPGRYRTEDGQTLLAFARQAAEAIENARLHEETRRWADRLQVLYQVSTAAATAASLEETLQHTVRAVQQAMGPDNVSLLLLEPKAGELVIRAWAGFPGGPTLMRRQVGVGVPGWVVQTGQPALIPDVRRDSRYHACDEAARSELCVPLQVGQRMIGALNLESRQPGAFTDNDLQLLVALSGHLAAIIENARLGEEAKVRAEILARRNRHLTLLHEIARVASSTLKLPDLYQALADTLAQIVGGDGCYITRIDETTGQVLAGAAYGPSGHSYGRMYAPPGERTLTESVLEAGRPLPVEDVFHSPYLSPRTVEMFPARSMLGLPLRLGERDLGAVLIAFDEPHTFAEEEITWATQAVDLAALALENARLYEQVTTWATELEQRVEVRTRELQEAQSYLLHAERLAALGQLSAGLAHEIGHPLGLIHGYAELLNEEQPDHPYLRPIRNATERLMSLVDQLRNFSRPAAEERSPVAIHEIVGRVLALAEQELIYHRVQVVRHLAADLPLVEADGQQLEQVFLNLVLNARDAMPQGGELTVCTYSEADQVLVAFADTGAGVPAENLERIFEPYFTTKEGKGTGLGLAICRRIVEAHGGKIEVESEAGAGATFRVCLPPGSRWTEN